MDERTGLSSSYAISIAAVLITTALIGANSVAAVIDCSSTTQVLLNGADPTDDYENDDNDDPDHVCIEIQGNGVSDFNNHTVTCTNEEGCGPAIKFTDIDGTSTVRSAVISGPFTIGIDGSGAPVDKKTVADRNRVSNITTSLYAVDVNTHNVVITKGAGCWIAIGFFPTDDLSGATTNQVVEDNFVDAYCVYGIYINSSFTGGTVPKVRRNFVRNEAASAVGAVGKVHVESNVLVGSSWGGPGDLSSGATAGNNLCDQITAGLDGYGFCASVGVPFDLP